MTCTKKHIDLTQEKANEIFMDIVVMSKNRQMIWERLKVSYTSTYQDYRIYIYKGEYKNMCMLSNKHEFLYFELTLEMFQSFIKTAKVEMRKAIE